MRSLILLLLGISACRPTKEQTPDTGDSVSVTDTVARPRPTLGFVYPSQGDTLMEGSTYVIRWSAPGIARINLGVAMGGKDKGHLLIDAPATADSLVWQVPAGFVTGFGVPAASNIRLRLEDAGDQTRFVDSEPFTIVGSGNP